MGKGVPTSSKENTPRRGGVFGPSVNDQRIAYPHAAPVVGFGRERDFAVYRRGDTAQPDPRKVVDGRARVEVDLRIDAAVSGPGEIGAVEEHPREAGLRVSTRRACSGQCRQDNCQEPCHSHHYPLLLARCGWNPAAKR